MKMAATSEFLYPLSPMQQGIMFHCLHTHQTGIYIQQVVGDLRERLDVAAFKQAWQQVTDRHSVLRTRLHLSGGKEFLQEQLQNVLLPWSEEDCRSMTATQQEERLQGYLLTDRVRGFVLSEAPLVRLALFCCAENHYHFVWTHHHVLLDGRSCLLILQEVFAFYEAIRHGHVLQLPPSRDHREYIELVASQDLTAAKRFWEQRIGSITAPTPLIVDRSVGSFADDSPGYDVQEIRLSKKQTASLQSIARQHQITSNTFVMAAWALLLARYSGEQDVVFGATKTCRGSLPEGNASLVGLFVNTLPMRVRVHEDMELLSWLKNIRVDWLGLRPFEHTPLVKIQQWSNIGPKQSLFESNVVFENYQLDEALKEGRKTSERRTFRIIGQSSHPLTLAGYAGTRLLLKLAYDQNRFDDGVITRMLGHLQSLLTEMISKPKQRLSNFTLLTEVERHQVLSDWNNTQAVFPGDRCLHQLFEDQVERSPNAVALEYEDCQVTYEQLNARANQLAHYLKGLGTGPEVLVGICSERGPELFVGLLAILKAGGAYLPLEPAYPEERQRFMLEEAGVRILLIQAHMRIEFGGDDLRVVNLDKFSVAVGQGNTGNPHSGVTPDNLAYGMYTSGSTGRPKLVRVEHHSAVNFISFATGSLLDPEELAVVPFTDSVCFDASISQIFGPLTTGGRLVPLTSLLEVPGSSLADSFTAIGGTPSGLYALLDGFDLPGSVRVVGLGGEVTDESLIQRLASYKQIDKVINYYGPTEATVCCSIAMLFDRRLGRSLSGSVIGKPISNVQIYLLDDCGRPVPVGVPGELYIGGAGLARGQVNHSKGTEPGFVPNGFSSERGARLYRTGDIALFLPDGNIEFLGRLDQQVKLRGFRIELSEIELALSQHKAVKEAVVVLHNKENDPGLAAYVTLAMPIDEESSVLRAWLKTRLPEYMLPASFTVLDKFPLTSSDKIDRKALPAPDLAIPMKHQVSQTETEYLLCDLWSQVLGIEVTSTLSDFFEVGGHSLSATQLVSRIRDNFGIEMSLRTVFDHPILQEQAEWLDKRNYSV